LFQNVDSGGLVDDGAPLSRRPTTRGQLTGRIGSAESLVDDSEGNAQRGNEAIGHLGHRLGSRTMASCQVDRHAKQDLDRFVLANQLGQPIENAPIVR